MYNNTDLRDRGHRSLVAGHRPDFLQPLRVPGDDLPVETGGEERAAEVRQRLDAEGMVAKGRAELPIRHLVLARQRAGRGERHEKKSIQFVFFGGLARLGLQEHGGSARLISLGTLPKG